jgi:hypothetical protein
VSNPFTIDERLDMVRNTLTPIGSGRSERLIDLVMDFEHHSVAEVSALIS